MKAYLVGQGAAALEELRDNGGIYSCVFIKTPFCALSCTALWIHQQNSR